MKASEILDRAADVIERNGWHQGEFYKAGSAPDSERCKVCAGGAINLAADHVVDYSEADGWLRVALDAFAIKVQPGYQADLDSWHEDPDDCFEPDVYDAIAYWNDDDDRTAEQVIAELRACAAAEREAGR